MIWREKSIEIICFCKEKHPPPYHFGMDASFSALSIFFFF